MQPWNDLVGKSLAGTYSLEKLLRIEGESAFFATHYQDKPAAAFLTEKSKNEDQLIANLEAASRVKHANIIGIERVGRARIDGVPVTYAILEATEENLADVLRERPLTVEETTEIAESLVAGLGALHEHGLMHGRVTPANIFAIGDTIKLRGDCIQKVPASAKDKPETYAQDLGDLGAVLFESLTQRKLTSPNESAIGSLPAPFRGIVQSAVTGRWGLTDISAALKRSSLESAHPIPAGASPAEAVQTSPSAAKSRPSNLNRGQATVLGMPASGHAFTPIRLFALLAVVVVFAGAWYFFRKSDDGPRPAAIAPQPSLAQTQSDALTPSTGHGVWRVVVYTYAREGLARHKVDALLRTHPELKPEVFTPSGHRPYLVTVGGAMSRDEAERIRDKARSAGLPSDAYAQNYTH